MKFSPLTFEAKVVLCRAFGCEVSNLKSNIVNVQCQAMGKPRSVKRIRGDGNCFFRAISFAMSGTEDNHVQLRTACVNHLLRNANKLKCFLRDGFANVEDYVMRQRMFDAGTWATEVEILAMSHMLCIDIYTFDEVCKWYKFSANNVEESADISDMGIYLNHKHRVHYDVVTSVNDLPLLVNDMRDEQGHSCKTFDACPDYTEQSDDKQSERCVKQVIDKSNNEKTTGRKESVKRCTPKKRKRVNLAKHRKLMKERMREKYREKTCISQSDVTEGRKRKYDNDKYKNDVDFRETKKAKCREYKKMKYKDDEKYREQVIGSIKFQNKVKYHSSPKHRLMKIDQSKRKYETNLKFQEEVKNASNIKYNKNEDFRKEVKFASKLKYPENDEFRAGVKDASK